MSEVHQLIFRHGVEGARTMAGTRAERHAIDAAALILAEEESRLGITHAGFAMTSLPHKRIEEELWKRKAPRRPRETGAIGFRRAGFGIVSGTAVGDSGGGLCGGALAFQLASRRSARRRLMARHIKSSWARLRWKPR